MNRARAAAKVAPSWEDRSECLLTLSIGLGYPASESGDFLEPALIEHHCKMRLHAFLMLRYAAGKGFMKHRALQKAVEGMDIESESGSKHGNRFTALCDELFSIVPPDHLLAQVKYFYKPTGATLQSKAQWLQQLTAMTKTLPGMPDDQTIVALLIDIIEAEQRNLHPENLAVLCGLAAGHLARVQAGFPVAKHADAQGRPIYTEVDVAQYVGATVDQVRAEIDQMKAAGELDGCIFPLSADDINPLH